MSFQVDGAGAMDWRELERRWRSDRGDERLREELVRARRRAGLGLSEELFAARRSRGGSYHAPMAGEVYVRTVKGEQQCLAALPGPGYFQVPECRSWLFAARLNTPGALQRLISSAREQGWDGLALGLLDPLLGSLRGEDLAEALQELPSLRSLELDSGLVSPGVIERLAGSLTLWSLHINASYSPSQAPLREFEGFTELHELSLRQAVLEPPLWRAGGLSRELFALDLSWATAPVSRLVEGWMSPDIGPVLEGLSGLRSLSRLSLQGLRLSFDELRQLKVLRDCTGLRELNLSAIEALRGLTFLSHGSGLERLELSHCVALEDEALADLSEQSELRELDLNCAAKIGDEGIRALRRLPSLRRLELVRLERLTSAGFAALAELVSLEELDLEHCTGLADADLEALAQLPNLRRLKVAVCPKLTAAGIRKFKTTKIEEIDVTACKGLELDVEDLRAEFGERLVVKRAKRF